MSLRSRLLIAIGVIALVALAVADVVTYSSLESFLYQRVDQQLDQQSLSLDHFLNGGAQLNCRPQLRAGRRRTGRRSTATTFPPTPCRNTRSRCAYSTGGVVDGQNCAAYVDDTAYSPQIPSTIPGYTVVGDDRRGLLHGSVHQGRRPRVSGPGLRPGRW